MKVESFLSSSGTWNEAVTSKRDMYPKVLTCPITILLKMVLRSFSLTSRSMNVSLFVLTWNESFVKRTPDTLNVKETNEITFS